MKIGILGGTGFVGSHLLPRLAAAGHQLRVLSPRPVRHRHLNVVPNCRLIDADPYDADKLADKLSGCQAAINLVGILNERGRNGAGFHKAHVELVEHLITACGTAGVQRVLQMSALKAGQGSSHYLQTKGLAEQRLQQASPELGLKVTYFQPSVIFGPGDSFFNRFLGLLKLAPVLPLAGAKSRFQPVYVGDVVEAMTRSLEMPETADKHLQLGGPRQYSLQQLVEFAADAAGLRRKVIGIPNWAARVQAAIMDFVPGKPFSTDNYKSLQLDSVCDSDGFKLFSIAPQSIEAIVPDYLRGGWRQARLNRCRSDARR